MWLQLGWIIGAYISKPCGFHGDTTAYGNTR